jgi:muramoyltetrapeptide carboxypeptidase
MTRGAAKAGIRPGDRIAVVATGFAVREAELRSGLAALGAMGYDVAPGAHVLEQDGYLAGADERRAEDLLEALASPDVRAIWFARGGYGTARLLPRIPWDALATQPKLLIGYSDLTALFNPFIARTGGTCLYGPVVAELGDPAAFHRPSLAAALAGRPVEVRFARRQVLAPGRASGVLLGGNLAVLTHLLGTPFAAPLDGAVLFLEETGEQVYRIDRMLTQLGQAGALSALAGVILGGFAVEPRERFPPDRDLDAVLREALLPLGIPVVRGLRAGHVAGKLTLPLGRRATIDTAAGTLRVAP